jgi:hypothetical protein
MVNNVIGVVNYVIAARPSLLNFMIADRKPSKRRQRAHFLTVVPAGCPNFCG